MTYSLNVLSKFVVQDINAEAARATGVATVREWDINSRLVLS